MTIPESAERTDPTPDAPSRRSRLIRRAPWILGAVVLAGVIVASLHFTEGRDFIRLAEHARPSWLLVAIALQVLTYWCQGETWRAVTRASGHRLGMRFAYELSLAKLFIDQAVPSAGVSGTVMMARALEQKGVPRKVTAAGVVVTTTAYNIAYVASLAGALAIMALHGITNILVLIVSVLFTLFGLALAIATIKLSGRHENRIEERFNRLGPLRKALAYLVEADPSIVRNPLVTIEASLLQFGIVVLDAATIWVLVRSLGMTASVGGVFASFMISNLFRTVGVVPGGLGTFEATSVLTLKLAGLPVPVALSATLMFRGLSFWLPMLPGLWFIRHGLGGAGSVDTRRSDRV